MKWAELVFAQPMGHPERISEEMLHKATERQITRRSEIVLESVNITCKTKYEDTRRGRIDLCKKHHEYFRQLKPYADKKQQARSSNVKKHEGYRYSVAEASL